MASCLESPGWSAGKTLKWNGLKLGTHGRKLRNGQSLDLRAILSLDQTVQDQGIKIQTIRLQSVAISQGAESRLCKSPRPAFRDRQSPRHHLIKYITKLLQVKVLGPIWPENHLSGAPSHFLVNGVLVSTARSGQRHVRPVATPKPPTDTVGPCRSHLLTFPIFT